MKKRMLLHAGLAVAAVIAVGCASSVKPVPRTTATIGKSPFIVRMQTMQLDCVVFADAHMFPQPISHEEMDCAMDDIRRKSDAIRGFWKRLRTAAKAVHVAAKVKNNDALGSAYLLVRKGCCDCHIEYMSFEERGYTDDRIQAWIDDPSAPLVERDSAETPDTEAPTSPNKDQMQRLWDHAAAMWGSYQSGTPGKAKAAAEGMIAACDERIEGWTEVYNSATLLRSMVLDREAAEDIEEGYNELSAACISCHGSFAKDYPALPTISR